MGGAYQRIILQTELGHFSLKKGGAYQNILQTENKLERNKDYYIEIS